MVESIDVVVRIVFVVSTMACVWVAVVMAIGIINNPKK